jgi:hypothetical protein
VKYSIEEQKRFSQRRQDRKPRKAQILSFLRAFYAFAPLREMLLLFHASVRSF